MGNPVVYFEIVGRDARALQDFYRQAFDWQIGPPIASGGPKDYAMVFPQAEGCINGGIGGGIGDRAGHVTFYIEVPDIKSVLRKVETLGGKRIMGPESIPNGPTIALFKDPEGHLIGLVQSAAAREKE